MADQVPIWELQVEKTVAGDVFWCTQVSSEDVRKHLQPHTSCSAVSAEPGSGGGRMEGLRGHKCGVVGTRVGNQQMSLHTGVGQHFQRRNWKHRKGTECFSSFSKMNKAGIPPCSTRRLAQESFVKGSCGSFNYEEDRILSHFPLIRYSLSLLGL